MKRRTILALLIFALLLPLRVWSKHALSSIQKTVIDMWLREHPSYRLATDADCGCDADVRIMRVEGYGGRWKPVPDYHPYVASGDFNGDGVEDFAVAVVNRSKKTRKFTLLVFNGPFSSSEINPAFMDTDVDLRGIGFFYGPPRPKHIASS